MADVFISYASADRILAVKLAAFFGSKGLSVWWDNGLRSGDQFRNQIMHELSRAKVVVVLWTPASTISDWVQSEAGRAHYDRKLVPVKLPSITAQQIPPPFDVLHTEDVSKLEQLHEAVVARMSVPIAISSDAQRSMKTLLHDLMAIGLALSTAITLLTNLKGILALSRALRLVLANWADFITSFWRTVLFFLPRLGTQDALILTMMVLLLTSLSFGRSLSHTTQVPTPIFIAGGYGATFIIAAWAAGAALATDTSHSFSTMLAQGIADALSRAIGDARSWQLDGAPLEIWLPAIANAFVSLAPLALGIALCYALGVFITSQQAVVRIVVRSYRIALACCVMLGINQLCIWLEAQPWVRILIE